MAIVYNLFWVPAFRKTQKVRVSLVRMAQACRITHTVLFWGFMEASLNTSDLEEHHNLASP